MDKAISGNRIAVFAGGAGWRSDRSASTVQRRSRLALIERCMAAAPIDTPGLRQTAIASALNSALCLRLRRPTRFLTHSEYVSI